jgi:hypothetical protein
MNCYPSSNREFTCVTDEAAELAGVCVVTPYVGESYPDYIPSSYGTTAMPLADLLRIPVGGWQPRCGA